MPIAKENSTKIKVVSPDRRVRPMITKKVKKSKTRTVKKITEKKAVAKKNLTASLSKKGQAVKIKRKIDLSKRGKNDAADPIVHMPTTTSLRLLEKVEIYRLWYQDKLPQYAATAARFGGYTFIFLGAFFVSGIYLVNNQLAPNPAATICAIGTCQEVPDSDLPADSPLITFHNIVPPRLSAATDLLVKVENTAAFTVYLQSLESGEKIVLNPLETLPDNSYRYLIPVDTLAAAAYTMYGEAAEADTTYRFTGSTFSVVGREATAPALGPDSLLATTTKAASLEVSTTTGAAVEITPAPVVSQTSNHGQDILITLNEKGNAKFLSIKTGDVLPKSVEIHSQLPNSRQSIFLGLATLVESDWVFSLSALDLPAVSQVLYASFLVDDRTYASRGVAYLPTSKPALNPASKLEDTIFTQKIENALADSGSSTRDKQHYFSKTSSTTNSFDETARRLAPATLLSQMDEVMNKQATVLDELLGRYAAALAGGNSILIALADKVLAEHSEKLVRETSAGAETLVPSLRTLLTLRYQTLKAVVATKEKALAGATNDLTRKDTDGDGITDFDEITLYGTSADSADSDEDGVLDGIEIITGSDPLKVDLISFPAVDQMINEENNLVTIDSVEPLIYQNDNELNNVMFVRVKGQAVPNSFVYIFNNAEAAVGVIKTSATGDFVYTFEKDLRREEQKILAAVVDNAGVIVSRSKIYSFVKSPNAFSAAAIVTNQPFLTPEDNRRPTLSANAIASIVVIAFGLILLLLNQTLLTRREPRRQNNKS